MHDRMLRLCVVRMVPRSVPHLQSNVRGCMLELLLQYALHSIAMRGMSYRQNEMSIPAAVEFLDTITPQFIGDLVAWGVCFFGEI